MSVWWAQHAWLGGDRVAAGVLIETARDRITGITQGVTDPPSFAQRLPGLTIPGLVNAHSHAFHRALRGRTQAERGSFWTWREQMYAVAARLQPDSYYALARATFAEMLLAGITAVGEFHYVHHDTGGAAYADPIAMSRVIARAAQDAGIRLTLLDTCYLAGGFGREPGTAHVPLSEAQRRFGDASAAAWAARASLVRDAVTSDTVRVGAALHSVRAVPADQMDTVVQWARTVQAPLHAHVSEQPAENEDCVRVYGATPTQHLAGHGFFDSPATAVHATHLTEDDQHILGTNAAFACFCVTTERDLADGIGPAAELAGRGARLALGSDSHAVIDLLEEARGLELDERLSSRRRGHFRAADLLAAATVNGAASLGWDDLGTLTVGSLADFCAIRLDSVRTAGVAAGSVLETALFAGGAADIATVVVGGQTVVEDGRHVLLADVAGELQRSIDAVTANS